MLRNEMLPKKKFVKPLKIMKKKSVNLLGRIPKRSTDYVNSKTKSQVRIADLIQDDGTEVTDNEEKAELFNKFFSSVFTREDLTHIPNLPPKTVHSILHDICFTESDIQDLLLKLNCNKSPGPDKIYPRILKECANVLASPLCTLFSQSLKEGKLPDAWKDGCTNNPNIQEKFTKRCQ